MKPLDLISIATIRETVRAIDPDDDDLLLGMIEGSTDAGELLDALLERQATVLVYVAGNKGSIDKLQKRNARLIRQDEATKAGMLKVLEAGLAIDRG